MEPSEFECEIQRRAPAMQVYLPNLLQRFDTVIASKRRSSLIRSFEDLAGVLVKRAFIDPFDRSSWSSFFDTCQFAPVPNISIGSSVYDRKGAPVHLNPSAIEYLSSKIGVNKWRNFGRSLKVTEVEINRIQLEHGDDSAACVREVLKSLQLPWVGGDGNVTEKIAAALHAIRRDDMVGQFRQLM